MTLSFWAACRDAGLLLTRLKKLNGKAGFRDLLARLEAGEADQLDLYQDRSHELFYALWGSLEKAGSRLTTLNLRWVHLCADEKHNKEYQRYDYYDTDAIYGSRRYIMYI